MFSIDVPRAFATIQSRKLDKNMKFVVEPQISYEASQLEKRPEYPKEGHRPTQDEWIEMNAASYRARSDNPAYRRAVLEFVELQNREPKRLPNYLLVWMFDLWCYKHRVIKFERTEHDPLLDDSREVLLVKRFLLRSERNYEIIRREVEALENVEKLQGASREPISESVRLFVWQRDRGQCVKCGSRERLEFDHIIPVVEGGSGTERNVQLLCETCNRSKGATI